MIIGSATLGGAGGLGLWGLLADARLVPGRSVVDTMLGRCDIEVGSPNVAPGKVLKASFYSTQRKRTVQYQIIYPPNAAPGVPLPVCVYLHGDGADETEAVALGVDLELAVHTNNGLPGYVVLALDGGDSYWHPRANGDNPIGMILTDVPVLLRQYGLPTTKLGLIGVSSGGYGALLVASEAPAQFVGVATISPTIWHSYEEVQDARPNTFDSADDFRQYGDLRTRTDALKTLPVRIDCGDSDTHEANLRRLAEQLPPDTVFFRKGCHDGPFARSAVSQALLSMGGDFIEAAKPPPA